MFSKSRTDAASPKAAPKAAKNRRPKPADADKVSRAEKRAEKRATKAGEKAASQVSGKVGTADRLAAARAAAAAVTDEITSSRASKRAEKKAAKDGDSPVYAPGEEPAFWNLSEWSLRRKVALVLAVPVTLAAVFGGLRINAERQLANNYAASSSQVTVLGPAIAYLAAAEHAAVVARAEGIDNPKLDAAQKEVVDAGTKLVEARDQADLTPTQLRQVNDVISLSEQMRNGMAYVSLTSSVSQVRQLERGVTQIISTIIDEQTRPDPGLLVLAQALDGRLSVALQEIQVSNSKTIPANPVELYTEFGVELASIDRLAISLGQTDPRVLEIRQGNAQRVVNARGGNTKMVGETLRGLRHPHRRRADRRRGRPGDLHAQRQGAHLGRLAHHRPRPARRDHPGAAGLAAAGRPDPPGAGRCARGGPRAAARGRRQDPRRRGPGRDRADRRHHARGDRPARPRRGRPAPPGRQAGLR